MNIVSKENSIKKSYLFPPSSEIIIFNNCYHGWMSYSYILQF